MGRWIWPWILVLIVVHLARCQQEFLRQPTYTEVNPGQTAQLDCSVLNKKGNCGWQKDRKPQGLIGTGKYSWNGDQERGDCSLLVTNASLDLDDGLWECQVTASSLETRDALSSREVRLLVRVAPIPPTIEFHSVSVSAGENLTAVADRNTSVRCISRHGNPPAVLRWFLGSDEVTSMAEQTNASEPDFPKLWQANSTVRLTLTKEQNGLPLKCVAYHEAYERKLESIVIPLNIQYVPTAVVERNPKEDVEDGKDRVRLECAVDANPSAVIIWRKDGRELSATGTLDFTPVRKEDAGLYTCEGRNVLGSGEAAVVQLDVKYSPTNVRVFPRATQAKVHNQTSLTCMADGNPPPRYIWLFSATGDPTAAKVKGVDATLHIDNVTYEAEGTYVCMATNSVNGEERAVQSEEVNINVFGIPQILSTTALRNPLQVERGEDATLEVPFCSDPPPTVITWEWEDFRLAVGEGRGKFIAEQVSAPEQPSDCYAARLIVQNAEAADARYYELTVQNERGADSFILSLNVGEPVSMSAVIGIVIGCLIVLVVVVLLVLYAFRAEKWCFQKNSDFKTSNVDGDIDGVQNCLRSKLSSRPGAIPPDALYTLPANRFVKCDDDHKRHNNQYVTSQNDQTKKNNSVCDLEYTEVEVPKLEANLSNSLACEYKPHPHDVADI